MLVSKSAFIGIFCNMYTNIHSPFFTEGEENLWGRDHIRLRSGVEKSKQEPHE